MRINIHIRHMSWIFLVSAGIFFAQEDSVVATRHVMFDEHKWLNYPKAEHMFTCEELQARNTSGACKAYREHARHNPSHAHDTGASASATGLWKLKHDELYTQCSIETLEQTIARLQAQLKKDRELLQKTKIEQRKFVAS